MIKLFELRKDSLNVCDSCELKSFCFKFDGENYLDELLKQIGFCCNVGNNIIFLPTKELKKKRFWKDGFETKTIKKPKRLQFLWDYKYLWYLPYYINKKVIKNK